MHAEAGRDEQHLESAESAAVNRLEDLVCQPRKVSGGRCQEQL